MQCKAQNFINIALIGIGDLADIANLVAYGTGLQVATADVNEDFKSYDATLITDVFDPQGTYDLVKHKIENDRLLTLKLSHISRVLP